MPVDLAGLQFLEVATALHPRGQGETRILARRGGLNTFRSRHTEVPAWPGAPVHRGGRILFGTTSRLDYELLAETFEALAKKMRAVLASTP